MASQKEYIQLIDGLFKGRRDAYGALNGCCIKKPLTDTEIRQHIKGIERRGVYPLSPDIMDGSGVFWGCADIDDGDLNKAQEVQENLNHIGIPAYIERSKSKGFHVWIFFSEPIPAKITRAILAYAVEDHGYEIFPKQTAIAPGGYGNYVNLPFFGADAKEGRTVFLDPESGYKAFPEQNEFLKSIQKTTPRAVEALMNDGEIEIEDGEVLPEESHVEKREYTGGNAQKVLEECGFIQHCKHEAVKLSEPAWYAMICNLAMLEYGPELIHQLSEPFHSYSVDETNRKIQHALDVDMPHSCNSIKAEIFNCERDCGVKCPIQKGRGPGENPVEDQPEAKPKISGSSPYFEGSTFIPLFLGDALMKDYSFVTSTGKIYLYTDGVYEPIDRSVIAKHCRNRLNKYARTNRVAEVMAHISDMTYVEADALNNYPHLINLKNGMLDWESGELIDHAPDYLSTMRIPVEYHVNADQEPVRDLLSQWVGDGDVPTLQEYVGYCLLPDTRYEKALMLTGSGANGKSCFIDWVGYLIGENNTSQVTLQELSAHKFKRAQIFGKLLNTFADLDSQSLASASYFKVVVSGDRMEAERKGRDPFSFRPFAKLIYSANDIPTSPDNTYAYFRRWIIVDFPNMFTKGTNADEDLMAKLTTDAMLSGLFSFALDGLRRLRDKRCFTISKSAEGRLSDYQKANDPVSSFLDECCGTVIGSKVKRQDLFQEFISYCREQEYKAVNNRQFYNRIRSHRIIEKRIDGADYFADIAIAGRLETASGETADSQQKLDIG